MDYSEYKGSQMKPTIKKALLELPPLRKPSAKTPYYLEQQNKLLNACQEGNLRTVIHIMEEAEDTKLDLNELLNDPFTNHQWTPLMVAAYYGHLNIVYYLITNEASVSSHRYKIDIYWKSPSGATVFDIVNKANTRTRGGKDDNPLTEEEKAAKEALTVKLIETITKEKQRRHRLDTMPTKIGFHETNGESFKFVISDVEKKKHPMIGGKGGYFGGGIYFAQTEQESSSKALHSGMGFKCELKMGKCYKISNQDELKFFYKTYCRKSNSGSSDSDEEEEYYEIDPYHIPIDIMQRRLIEDDIDSVWGHQDETIINVDDRILQTGDEYVVYSADQVIIEKYYFIRNENQWIETKKSFKELQRLLTLPFKEEISYVKNYRAIAYEPIQSMAGFTGLNPMNNNALWVLDLRSQKYIVREFELLTNIRKTNHMQFHPEKPNILIIGIESILYFLDIKQNHIDQTYLFGIQKGNTIESFVFSLNCNYLFVVDNKNNLVIFNKTTTDPYPNEPPTIRLNRDYVYFINLSGYTIKFMAQSPTENLIAYIDKTDGKTIKFMTYADEITYTETEQLSVLKNTYKHPEDLDGLVFSPDGKLLALYGMNTPLVLMDVKTLQIKSTLDFTEKGIQTVVFSPNGKYLAAGFVDSTLMIWDIHPNPSEPKLIRYIPVPDIRAIDAIGFSQDNGELFLASHDKRFGYHGLIHIYDVKDLS
jgi:hypothetical protein